MYSSNIIFHNFLSHCTFLEYIFPEMQHSLQSNDYSSKFQKLAFQVLMLLLLTNIHPCFHPNGHQGLRSFQQCFSSTTPHYVLYLDLYNTVLDGFRTLSLLNVSEHYFCSRLVLNPEYDSQKLCFGFTVFIVI